MHTISDAARHSSEWRAAFGYEFKERADGYPGLAEAYGLRFADIRIMDLGLLYRALAERQVDLVAGNATDGQIEHLKLTVLTDDRRYFPGNPRPPLDGGNGFRILSEEGRGDEQDRRESGRAERRRELARTRKDRGRQGRRAV